MLKALHPARHTQVFEPINLDKLKDFIMRGKIDSSQPIDMNILWRAGAVGKIEDGVKLLATVGPLLSVREPC